MEFSNKMRLKLTENEFQTLEQFYDICCNNADMDICDIVDLLEAIANKRTENEYATITYTEKDNRCYIVSIATKDYNDIILGVYTSPEKAHQAILDYENELNEIAHYRNWDDFKADYNESRTDIVDYTISPEYIDDKKP